MRQASKTGNGAEYPLVGVVEKLEECGVGMDEFQLIEFVDPDALQQVMASCTNATVKFAVRDVHLTVSRNGVTAVREFRDR